MFHYYCENRQKPLPGPKGSSGSLKEPERGQLLPSLTFWLYNQASKFQNNTIIIYYHIKGVTIHPCFDMLLNYQSNVQF